MNVFWCYFSTVLDLQFVTIVPHVMPVPDGVAVPHPLGHHHQELVQLNRSVLVLREGPFNTNLSWVGCLFKLPKISWGGNATPLPVTATWARHCKVV
jgi:hypothetical protein